MTAQETVIAVTASANACKVSLGPTAASVRALESAVRRRNPMESATRLESTFLNVHASLGLQGRTVL